MQLLDLHGSIAGAGQLSRVLSGHEGLVRVRRQDLLRNLVPPVFELRLASEGRFERAIVRHPQNPLSPFAVAHERLECLSDASERRVAAERMSRDKAGNRLVRHVADDVVEEWRGCRLETTGRCLGPVLEERCDHFG